MKKSCILYVVRNKKTQEYLKYDGTWDKELKGCATWATPLPQDQLKKDEVMVMIRRTWEEEEVELI